VIQLLNLLLPVEPLWVAYGSLLKPLNAYAVLFRYPGQRANRRIAKEALAICRTMRKVVRISMGLKP
jgi:hypothetical protein